MMSDSTATNSELTPVVEMIGVDIPSPRQPNRPVLENVNWRVMPGDYWFVGGLERSGKTDLLSVASGVVPPLRGTCRLFGVDVMARRPEDLPDERVRIGLVFDGGRLLHHLTLAENVALPVGYHSNRSLDEVLPEVQPLLEMTEMTSIKDYFPASVSRSWQQRAGLARALALRPEALLVDNPLSGLDPQDTRWWLQLLRQLWEGHPLFDRKKITLAVTGDSVRIWKDNACQFAVLKDRQFHVLDERPGPNAHENPLLKHLLPADLIPL